MDGQIPLLEILKSHEQYYNILGVSFQDLDVQLKFLFLVDENVHINLKITTAFKHYFEYY